MKIYTKKNCEYVQMDNFKRLNGIHGMISWLVETLL